MSFTADYPGAIVVEAAKYGYPDGPPNRPRAWCLHTPEELADSDPRTPYYFHNTTRNASTTYFVSYLGFVFQCVPEDEGAYGNAVEGKLYPLWASPNFNLNLQTLSVEIEGYAHDIHLTMPRGSPQWTALVDLMAQRCQALGIDPDTTIGHYQVSINRGDPGQLDIITIVADVKAKMQEESTMTPEEKAELRLLRAQVTTLIGQVGQLLAIADTQAKAIEYLTASEKEFRIVQGQVNQLLDQPSGDSYSDKQAVKAVKDAL